MSSSIPAKPRKPQKPAGFQLRNAENRPPSSPAALQTSRQTPPSPVSKDRIEIGGALRGGRGANSARIAPLVRAELPAGFCRLLIPLK